jgi:TDG/mug DNA glycosylase family protein
VDRATVDVYEQQSARYEALRRPRHRPQAQAFATRRLAATAVDLGSGPGWYTAALGDPVVALDAAAAMLRRTREVAPRAGVVQGDLAALPFRRGSLGGAWARNSYVHLRAVDVPLALADLHRALTLDAPVELTFFGRRAEGAANGPPTEGREVFPADDLPGRWFSTWPQERLRDVVEGAGFAIDELEREERHAGDVGFTVRGRRARTLPDLVGPDLHLLVCGLNPSEHAADAGVGYVTAGNRFWPAALAVGLVTEDRDPWHALRHHRVGMTDLVKRATPRAAALTTAEHRAGVARLERLCAWLQPTAVCVVGLAGWRAAVDRRATPGWQAVGLGGRPVYVMPSTSGLNAGTPMSAIQGHLAAAVAGP